MTGVHGFSLDGCELGVATAATQIEGGNADTNWHRWADEPGHIKDGSTPARAADHWNRVPEDIALLQELGVKHYRMGLEWARVEPERGVFDESAIEHYRDELTRLRDAGIKPLVTLHHFNNPWWLEATGAFENRDAMDAFLRYTRRMVESLDDLVDEWITFNEPNVYVVASYVEGTWPPGSRSPRGAQAVAQHLAEAHVSAYGLIHELQPSAKVGVAMHLRVFRPASKFNLRDIGAAVVGGFLFQSALHRAMSTGLFVPPLLQPKGVRPGKYYDFQGVNYYSRSMVTGLADGVAKDVPVNDLGWEIYPAGLGIVLRQVARAYPGPIYITENGIADSRDAFRPRFIFDHLRAVVTSGVPVERYYHWSSIDNWEWADGEGPRFGLIALDYETQTRTMRESGRFYADISANGAITDAAYDRWVAPCEYLTNAVNP
ncbi:MAG: glycoside hydrolase family 1 protein [Propionibacteriaceae bacterium]|nr:glycoside hydrolase family 1 protein [Propionibacteriaceae bacterium]